MFTLKTNQSDLKRIQERLTKIAKQLQSKDGPLYRYRFILLGEYKNAIAEAMGSVDATGGTARIDFLNGASVYWKALAPYTISLKAWKSGKSTSGIEIWKDEGVAHRSVKIYESEGFAGIKKSDSPEGYEHAITTEFGDLGDLSSSFGNTPPRALFTIANQTFRNNKDAIVKAIHGRVKDAIIDSGWGT